VAKSYKKIVKVLFILLFSVACNNPYEINQERSYPKSPVGVVNINTASKEELMHLPLISEEKAHFIIEWRKKYPFKRVEEIIYVPRIGEFTYLQLRKYLVVEGKTTLKQKVLHLKYEK